jgi:hypothetical protein
MLGEEMEMDCHHYLWYLSIDLQKNQYIMTSDSFMEKAMQVDLGIFTLLWK